MKKVSAFYLRLSATVPRSLALSFLAPVFFLFALPPVRAEEARFFRIVGPGATAITGITPDGYVTWTNELTNVICTVQTAQSLTSPSNWVDYVQVPVSSHVVINRLFDLNPPSGMALIPAGSFTMGNCMNTNEGSSSELPLHTVNVSAFYMDRYEVSKALWDDVYNWAITNGYSFDNSGSGKAANHPVQTITWYDAVKWCNARSEKENKIPAYYTDAGQTTVYRSGQVNVQTNWVNWSRGYRLPTEAEGGKAGRGGRTSVSVGGRGHNFVEPGQLLCFPIGLRLRCQPDGGLPSDVQRWSFSIHESGGIFCTERLRAVRHGGECVGVVLGLVFEHLLQFVAGV